MKLEEGMRNIELKKRIRFEEIFDDRDMDSIIRNKGKTGQIIERAIGLRNTPYITDFEDGELKTNKCDRFGNPKETMFITQIKSIIDDLLNETPFENSRIYRKINNLLYVQVCKEGDPKDWKIIDVFHINLEDNENIRVKEQLKKDYSHICKLLNNHIQTSSDGFIHTSTGEYIQIRSKDSKPYSPIYSRKYNKDVSNKNHAFYFKKEFMNLLRRR